MIFNIKYSKHIKKIITIFLRKALKKWMSKNQIKSLALISYHIRYLKFCYTWFITFHNICYDKAFIFLAFVWGYVCNFVTWSWYSIIYVHEMRHAFEVTDFYFFHSPSCRDLKKILGGGGGWLLFEFAGRRGGGYLRHTFCNFTT